MGDDLPCDNIVADAAVADECSRPRGVDHTLDARMKKGWVSGKELRAYLEHELELVFASDPWKLSGGWGPRMPKRIQGPHHCGGGESNIAAGGWASETPYTTSGIPALALVLCLRVLLDQ